MTTYPIIPVLRVSEPVNLDVKHPTEYYKIHLDHMGWNTYNHQFEPSFNDDPEIIEKWRGVEVVITFSSKSNYWDFDIQLKEHAHATLYFLKSVYPKLIKLDKKIQKMINTEGRPESIGKLINMVARAMGVKRIASNVAGQRYVARDVGAGSTLSVETNIKNIRGAEQHV